MIGGFAVVAYPAEYGNSGVMTFIVNHDGKVFQKNLGANTAAVAKGMKEYNPDKTWTEVKSWSERENRMWGVIETLPGASIPVDQP